MNQTSIHLINYKKLMRRMAGAITDLLGKDWRITHQSDRLLVIEKNGGVIEIDIIRGVNPQWDVKGKLGAETVWRRIFDITTSPENVAQIIQTTTLPSMRRAWKKKDQTQRKRIMAKERQQRAREAMRRGKFPMKRVRKWRKYAGDWQKEWVLVPDWNAWEKAQ